MSNLTDALIAAKLVGGSGGSGGGSGSVLPPFKFYTLVVTYDSTAESGEGRIYRCKDGQFERTHIVADFVLEPDVETGDNKVVAGALETEEGASEEDISDAAEYGWLSERVKDAIERFSEDDLNTLLPLMLFIS